MQQPRVAQPVALSTAASIRPRAQLDGAVGALRHGHRCLTDSDRVTAQHSAAAAPACTRTRTPFSISPELAPAATLMPMHPYLCAGQRRLGAPVLCAGGEVAGRASFARHEWPAVPNAMGGGFCFLRISDPAKFQRRVSGEMEWLLPTSPQLSLCANELQATIL